jgi:peroxiredoxin Q/BCP
MTERLSPGDAAPPLGLVDDTGVTHTWKTHAGERVVLYVYPAAMTPGCTKQACDFRDSLDALNAAGVTVLGLSPDKPEKLAKFRERDALTFPLLSDPDKGVLTAYAAYGEKQLYGKTVTGVIRSTFVVVVDAKGKAVIEHAFYNVKATSHVAKLRKDLGL